MPRQDPRLTIIFKNHETIIYLVDGEIVRRDFNREFTSGGNVGRYPNFMPESDIWVESTLNDKDKLFNTAHEIVERHLILWNNLEYNKAHLKSSKFEAAIRRTSTSIEDPIKLAVDITNLCKINWWLRNQHGHLWPMFICCESGGRKVDLEQFANRCVGKCAESKIYCPICGKVMRHLKNGVDHKFPDFFDTHKISTDIKDWISEEMVEWFEDRTKRHINLVQKYCEKIEKYDPVRFAGLIERGKEHDLSKYGEIEKDPYILISWNYKIKNSGKKPLEMPLFIKRKLNEATEHHIKTSKHHPEAWSPRKAALLNTSDRDKAPEKIIDATRMDILSVGELSADWLSMGVELHSDVVKWAKDNINKRWKFTKEQEGLIWELISVGIQ